MLLMRCACQGREGLLRAGQTHRVMDALRSQAMNSGSGSRWGRQQAGAGDLRISIKFSMMGET